MKFKLSEERSTIYKIDVATKAQGWTSQTGLYPIAITPIDEDIYNISAHYINSVTKLDSTSHYCILYLRFYYTKPEHYYSTNGGYEGMPESGYRFNFNTYSATGGTSNTVTKANGNARS